MRRATALFTALGLAALLSSGRAEAYCRTASCGDAGTGQACSPAVPGDCDKPLFWASPCVGFSVQKGASTGVSFADTEKLLHDAFAVWTSALCVGGGSPRIAITELAPADCDKHEYNQKNSNTNLVVYRDDKWPYEGTGNTLALTTVTYNLDTGEIYDADMELNSADNHFTLNDGAVEFDLLSIATHEAGHFLGLAHSSKSDATMFPDYKQGDMSLRTLSDDDREALCTVYPPGMPIPVTCDATPRHGFSTQCASDQPAEPTSSDGCSLAAPSAGAPGLAGLAAAVAIALGARRRKRR